MANASSGLFAISAWFILSTCLWKKVRSAAPMPRIEAGSPDDEAILV